MYNEKFSSVENGVRQFIFVPHRGVATPSSLRFGRAGFRVPVTYYQGSGKIKFVIIVRLRKSAVDMKDWHQESRQKHIHL